jgi:hypothetical protein
MSGKWRSLRAVLYLISGIKNFKKPSIYQSNTADSQHYCLCGAAQGKNVRECRTVTVKDILVNSSFRAERSGDPESSGLYSMCYGLFAALTLRAAPRAFNALRAFVRHTPE